MFLFKGSAIANLIIAFTVLLISIFIQDASAAPQYPQLFATWQPYPHFINTLYPIRSAPTGVQPPPTSFADQGYPVIQSSSGFHHQTAYFPPQTPQNPFRFDRFPAFMTNAHLPLSPYNPMLQLLFPSAFPTPQGATNYLVGNRQFTARGNTCSYFDDNGVCYGQSECLGREGRPTTYCRDFSKFCCIFQTSRCGSSYSEDVIYFRNPSWPLAETIRTPCGVSVTRKDNSICAVRINPQSLSLPANPGYCDDIGIAVSGVPGANFDTLCGNMNGQIYDIDVRSTRSIDITIKVNQRYTARWHIALSQISCSEFSGGSSWPQGGASAGGGGKPSSPPIDQETDTIGGPVGIPPINLPSSSVWPNQPQAPPVGEPGIFELGSPGTSELQKCGKSGRRSQDLLRDNEVGPAYNPLLQSLQWDVATVTDSIFSQYAGVPTIASGRITYGTITEPFEYPWSVAMYANGRFHCGASLISDRHILTAAHCVIKKTRIPSSLKLSIGDWNINTQEDGTNIEGKVAKVIVHPGYSATTLKYDVAVLTLTEKIQLTPRATPICLPPTDISLDGEIVTVTGWGRDEKNKLQSVLMEHSASVVPNPQCNDRWSEKGAPAGIIAATMMCMDPQDGDSCKGDSGGPAVMEYPALSGKFVQVGIVSFGSASCTDKKLPGVYTKVGKVIDWIKEQMV